VTLPSIAVAGLLLGWAAGVSRIAFRLLNVDPAGER
jgi:hypothetical protein